MSHVERRLTAIVFTDIVGYSALTGRDEMLAMELLQEHHDLLRPVFARHGGVEVKTIGDSFMLEFPSVVNAVSAAIEMQQTLADRNAGEPPPRHIVIRVGIHAGDVIFRDNDVFGEGVNIASRIEPLAAPGGICVSEDVARQIRNKIAFPVREMGHAELKNIDVPMKVFSVQLPWVKAPEKPKREAAAEKSRIASSRAPRAMWKWVAAAAVLVLVAGGAFLLLGGDSPADGTVAGAMSSVETPADAGAIDAPGSTEAQGTAGQAADGVPSGDAGEGDPPASAASSAPTTAPAAETSRPTGPSADEVRVRARAAYDAGSWNQAIEQFGALTRLRPRDAEAFYYLGRSYAASQDTERAILSLTQATALQDESPLYHAHLGVALAEAGRTDEALVALRRAAELGGHPDFAVDDLTSRIEDLEIGSELAGLVPMTATARHDHLVGSCSGSLTMTGESVAYVVEGDHAFNVWFADVAAVDASGDRLGIRLKSGRNLNFDLPAEERQTFGRIFELAGQQP